MAVHIDAALRGLVKPWNQLDQGGLCGTGLADNAYGLAGTDVEGNIRKNVFFRTGLVLEGDVVEADIAFFYLDGLCAVLPDVDLFVQHLPDTLPGSQGTGGHQEYVGKHHQGV